MRLNLRLTIAFLLIFSLFGAKGLAVQAGDVVINEVAWMGTGASANDEWIELFNPTGQSVDLAGWTLTANDGAPSITLSGAIAANGFLLLERSDDNTVKDIPADLIYTGSLSNGGETLLLKDDQGNLIDSANGNAGPWPAGNNASKATMERIDPHSGDVDANWTSHTSILQNGLDANGNPLNASARFRNSVTNRPPVCNNINTSTQTDVSVTIDLPAACSDPDADPLTFSLISAPASGAVGCNGNGQCSYTPDAGVSGSDSFMFKAKDPFGDSAAAQATIDIQAANTPPSMTFFVSNHGSDGNDGLTPATALETIQSAIDRSEDGGRVVVLGGVFQETLNLDKALTLETTGATTLNGGGGVAVAIFAARATLKGFSIEGASTGVLVAANADNVTLTQNALVGNGIGLDNQSTHTVEAGNNWWGCNAGPNQSGCDVVLGKANTSPWLVIRFEAPTNTPFGQAATLTLDFGKNTQGNTIAHVLSRPASLQVGQGGLLQTNTVATPTAPPPWLPWAAALALLAGGAVRWRPRPQRAALVGLLTAIIYLGGCGVSGQPGVHVIVFGLSQQRVQVRLLALRAGEITVSVVIDGQSLTQSVLFSP